MQQIANPRSQFPELTSQKAGPKRESPEYGTSSRKKRAARMRLKG